MKILLTGGSGLLGKELQKYLKCDAPNSDVFDITDLEREQTDNIYDVIIHAAAYTDVINAEIDKSNCFDVNVKGTRDLVEIFPSAKFVYISSEYAHNPLNFYSWTKLWGEGVVRKHFNHLIIRTSFVDMPFPHPVAFFDQQTQGDYVTIIAPMIAAEVLKQSRGTVYLGTGRKTMFELARRTEPNIKAISVDDIKSVKLPKDYE